MDLLFSKEQVEEAYKIAAKKITGMFWGPKNAVMVGILSGGAYSLFKLQQYLPAPLPYGFVSYSSYKNGTKSNGAPEIAYSSLPDMHKNVIVVDDILDTGTTINDFVHRFKGEQDLGRTMCVFTLLHRYRPHVEIEECEHINGLDFDSNKFVVGCGLDFDGHYRELDAIYTLSEKELNAVYC